MVTVRAAMALNERKGAGQENKLETGTKMN
jgi:hypothetical protein